MRPDRRALFDDDNGDIRVQRLETNGRGQTSGAGTDDHDVVMHRFSGYYRLLAHDTARHQVPVAGYRAQEAAALVHNSPHGALKAHYDSLSSRRASAGPGQTKWLRKSSFNSASSRRSTRSVGGFGSASPMRLTKCRMIVSQTFSPETEVSAARQTPQSRHTDLRALCLNCTRAVQDCPFERNTRDR